MAKQKFLVDIDVDGNKVTNLGDPTDNGDGANKQYVDDYLSNAILSDAGTPANDDKVLIKDTSDSGNLKTVNFSEFGGANLIRLAVDFVIYKNGANYEAIRQNDQTVFSTNTNARVVIQAVVDELESNNGGVIRLKAGDYPTDIAIDVTGDDGSWGADCITICGDGMHNTGITGEKDIDVFNLTENPLINFEDIRITCAGTGSAIKTTKSTTLKRGVTNISWKNLFIQGSYSATAGYKHTGYGLELDNFFRSQVNNLEMINVANGIHLTATEATFNPGDSTFIRTFIELNDTANGVILDVESNAGSVNQVEFVMFEGIGNGTGQKGVVIGGTAGSNHIHIRGYNMEEIDTVWEVERGYGNSLEANYVTATNNGTIIKFGANANSNRVKQIGFCAIQDHTITFIDDDSTWDVSHNIVEDVYLAIDTGGTLNNAMASHTRVRNIKGYNDGILASDIQFTDNIEKPITITISSNNADTNCALGNYFRITADANFTLTNPTNPKDGQKVMWEIIQDATGNRTITLGSEFALGTDIDAVTLTTTANKRDFLGAVYNSTTTKWYVVSFVKGY